MTTESQMVALLEWMHGKRYVIQEGRFFELFTTHCPQPFSCFCKEGNGWLVEAHLPPLTLDLMHEAETKLTRQQQEDYANELYVILPCDENHGPCGAGDEDIMTASLFQVTHAVKEHRLEALLRTTGKYIES